MKSSKLHLPKRRRVFARFLGKIQDALLRALAEEHAKKGLTRADLARILGTDKGFITRKLNGTSNITLETISDLAFAMDRDIQISFPPRGASSSTLASNYGASPISGTSSVTNDNDKHVLACAA